MRSDHLTSPGFLQLLRKPFMTLVNYNYNTVICMVGGVQGHAGYLVSTVKVPLFSPLPQAIRRPGSGQHASDARNTANAPHALRAGLMLREGFL